MHVAKNGRGGLGRGLNSLLGGAYEEAIPQEGVPQRVRVEADPRREVIRESVPAQKSSEPRQTYEAAPAVAFEEQEPESIVDNGVEVTIKGVAQREARPAPAQQESVATAVPAANQETDEVAIDSVSPNPEQPRTNFKREELEELAASIQKDGLLQPILVRPVGEGSYQIIAGERRWQASKLAGLTKVPIRIKDANDDKALELALIENIQRSVEILSKGLWLSSHDGASEYDAGGGCPGYVEGSLDRCKCASFGESCRGSSSCCLRKITAGHARYLVYPTKEGRERLTRKLVEEKLTVREAEALARFCSLARKTITLSRRFLCQRNTRLLAR